MPRKPIRVLIVDDSLVVRSVLGRVLNADPDIEVVGGAGDPYEARERIVELRPDVLTLDIEMPRMDGLTFLRKLMAHMPLPVVICSSVTREGADTEVKALELGAVEVVRKPSSTEMDGLKDVAIQLVDKVKAASTARVRRRAAVAPGAANVLGKPMAAPRIGRVRGMNYARAGVLEAPPELRRNQHKIVAFGASTGGTEALRVVLERLPVETPGIVIVQHMPENFTAAFAERLDGLCALRVKEAETGDRIQPGVALLAPGNMHLMVRRQGVELVADVRKGPLVCRHRPSVEVLFQSVARVVGPNAVGVMLTGMGGDGSNGMALMKAAGALNVAQDEASCVVFGMPKEAIRCGGVDRVEHLERIPRAVLELLCQR